MANRKEKTKLYYHSKINRALDYIEANLHKDICIREVASVAGISTYHFHRVFHAFTHESLYACIIRMRIESAAAHLLHSDSTVTSAAFMFGFNDASTFSRAFKKRFGVSPMGWKQQHTTAQKNNMISSYENSKIHHDRLSEGKYTLPEPYRRGPEVNAREIRFSEERSRKLYYVRSKGKYEGNWEFFRLLYRRLRHELLQGGLEDDFLDHQQIFVLYHDPLGITETQHLRVSMGIAITHDLPGQSALEQLKLEPGLYISVNYELRNGEYGEAWMDVYRNVLVQQGLEPRPGYAYELYSPDCYDSSIDLTRLDICLPVKKLL